MKLSNSMSSNGNFYGQSNPASQTHKNSNSTKNALSLHNSLAPETYSKTPSFLKKIVIPSNSTFVNCSLRKKKLFTVNLPSLLVDAIDDKSSNLTSSPNEYIDTETQTISTLLNTQVTKIINSTQRKLSIPHSTKIELKVDRQISGNKSRIRSRPNGN